MESHLQSEFFYQFNVFVLVFNEKLVYILENGHKRKKEVEKRRIREVSLKPDGCSLHNY